MSLRTPVFKTGEPPLLNSSVAEGVGVEPTVRLREHGLANHLRTAWNTLHQLQIISLMDAILDEWILPNLK